LPGAGAKGQHDGKDRPFVGPKGSRKTNFRRSAVRREFDETVLCYSEDRAAYPLG
jgi:hypothetical protein